MQVLKFVLINNTNSQKETWKDVFRNTTFRTPIKKKYNFEFEKSICACRLTLFFILSTK